MNTHLMKKILILSAFTLLISVAPVKAHAFSLGQLIDPLCLFACDNNPKHTTTTITNSYNHDNNNTNTTTVVNTTGATVACSTCGYGYPSTPQYPTQSQSPLGASCYSTPSSGNIGDTITWGASVYGGTGNYYITWSGNDGLSGYGTSIYKTYNNAGSKYASITVTSGGQSISQNCSNNVMIRDNYYNNNNYDYNYNNNYNNNYYSYTSPVYVSCTANTNFAQTETNVIWSANATGGNGYYTYTWNGTDYLSGSGRTLNTVYHGAGTKTASVTVYSGNQTITQGCSNSVTVGIPNYVNNNNNIQIACYPDKLTARIGAPVTWGVEATGGTGNFTYAWTGSDGLTGTMASIVKAYDTRGVKSAIVTVTSSNGQSASQICGNTVSVQNPTVTTGTTVRPATNNNQSDNDNGLSASALFSLKNVPWGWVAVLIILILFGTVLYLIYNRNKI